MVHLLVDLFLSLSLFLEPQNQPVSNEYFRFQVFAYGFSIYIYAVIYGVYIYPHIPPTHGEKDPTSDSSPLMTKFRDHSSILAKDAVLFLTYFQN